MSQSPKAHLVPARRKSRRSAHVAVLPQPPPGTALADLRAYLERIGSPPYRFAQVVRFLQDHDEGFEGLRQIPKGLRDDLSARFAEAIRPLRVVAAQRAEQVDKVLIGTRSGARFETVRARYRAGWSSVCVSSQAGCALGCTFCATGAVGFGQNLSPDEICAQVVDPFWRQGGAGLPDSVAFMGMGEALANPHLFPVLEMLTTPGYGGMSQRRITVSTVGFAPRLERLCAQYPGVTVTLSVHSPFPQQRADLIPLERKFPMQRSLAILDGHLVSTHRKIYLAYLLIDGVNDSPDHLDGVVRLVQGRSRPDLCHVSVIPYNHAAGVHAFYRSPPAERVAAFVAGLRARGLHATRRQQFGSSIDAACGQLHARYLSSEGFLTGATDAGGAAPAVHEAGQGGRKALGSLVP